MIAKVIVAAEAMTALTLSRRNWLKSTCLWNRKYAGFRRPSSTSAKLRTCIAAERFGLPNICAIGPAKAKRPSPMTVPRRNCIVNAVSKCFCDRSSMARRPSVTRMSLKTCIRAIAENASAASPKSAGESSLCKYDNVQQRYSAHNQPRCAEEGGTLESPASKILIIPFKLYHQVMHLPAQMSYLRYPVII